MKRILALDTTSHFGSLALIESDRIIEEAILYHPEGFSAVLFERIRGLLERHEWAVEDLDCFAAASGPGSFTGVRLGLTAVKGLAEATGIRTEAVSNLEALAACGSGPLRAVVLDARRGEVYAGVYNGSGEAVQSERVVKFREWLDSLVVANADEIEFLSTDFGPFRPALVGTRFENARVREQRALAPAVGRIAYMRLGTQAVDPAGIDANYIRRSDAELLFKVP